MNRPATIACLWLTCFMIASVWVGRTIDVQHDLQAFLPRTERLIDKLLLSRATSSDVTRLVFVAFEGGSLDQRLAASRDALTELRQLDGVERIANGAGGFDVGAFKALFPYRYLLDEPPAFDAESLRAALEARLGELRSPLAAAAKADLGSDPTASFRGLLRRLGETTTEPSREQGLWVTPDRDRSLMLATITDSGGDLGREEEVVQAMTRTLDAVAGEHGVHTLLAGRPALAAVARDSIRSSFAIGGTLASLLVIALLLWLFRSIGVLLLGILPLASGVIAGLALVLLVFGGVHGIALAFGFTLLGIAIDYPLHLFSHHRSGEPLAKTAKSIQRPLLLGALTTAAAFVVFGAGRTPGLGQLACFTGVGVLAAAITLRYVTPALAMILHCQPRTRSWCPLPAKAPAWLVPSLVVLAIAALFWLPMRGDQLLANDIAALNPLPDSAKQLDRKLRTDLGAPDLRYLLLISSDEPEAVLAQSDMLEGELQALVTEGGLHGFDAPSRYLPSLARQAEWQSRLPSRAALEEALEQASTDLPFRPRVFAPFVDAVEESRTIMPLDAETGRAIFAEMPLGGRLDQLLLSFDGRWHGFLPLVGVDDVDGISALAAASDGVDLVDLRAFSNSLLAAVSAEALWLLGVAILGAAVLLALLRNPLPSVARSLAVLLLSLTVTATILALLGERFTMFHILAALLVVGLGIDYSVFFSWQAADDDQRARTRQSLIACLLSTVTVFGLLAMSNIGVLRAIGLTVAVGACTTFAFAYAFFMQRQR